MPTWALAVALAGGVVIGWLVQGWRMDARISDMEANQSQALASANVEALNRTREMQAQAAQVDRERLAELRKSENEINELRDAVDSGAKRLLINVKCPGGVPGGAVSPGLGDGEGAELAPGARSDYHTLRSGLVRVESKLAACQDLLSPVSP